MRDLWDCDRCSHMTVINVDDEERMYCNLHEQYCSDAAEECE